MDGKQGNFFVVGGAISVGKSTLVNLLPYPQINELVHDDVVQDILLKNTYDKKRVAPEVIEFYFLELRKKKYQKYSNTLKTHVFDRSIFESPIFAEPNMSTKSYTYFERLWKKEVEELIKKSGKPKVYFLLSMKWETFKERLFKRGRGVETQNFEQNKVFFKNHTTKYIYKMVKILEMFNINYKIIETDNLTAKEVFQECYGILERLENGN